MGSVQKAQLRYRNWVITECPIEIILSGITTTTGSRNFSNLKIFVFILSNEGSFSHLFDSFDSQILLDYVWPFELRLS